MAVSTVPRSHGLHDDSHPHQHGTIDPAIVESREGVRVLVRSLAILGVTAIGQALVVVLTGSVALLADTIHNLGDALTAVPLAAAFILARRPPTRQFTYGLKRTEDLAGLFVVLAITVSAGVALYASIERILNPSTPDYLLAGMLAGALGVLGNEAVALYRIRQGRKMQSAALVADGYHARVDGLASLAVVIGLGAVWAGFGLADPIVGILVSLLILWIAIHAARDVGRRILDGIEPETVAEIERAAGDELDGVAEVEGVRARWLGHEIQAEVRVVPKHGVSADTLLALRSDLEHRLEHDVPRVRSLVLEVRPASALSSPAC